MISYICGTCKNQETDYCDECEHGVELFDHYEKVSKEEVEKLEQKRRKEAIKAISGSKIITEISNELLDAFNKAKMFAIDPERLGLTAFFGVYFGKDKLVATDTHRLFEMTGINIPKDIQDRFILSLDKDGATLLAFNNDNNVLKTNSYQKVLDGSNDHAKKYLIVDEIANCLEFPKTKDKVIGCYSDSVFLVFDDTKISVDEKYLNQILSLFGEDDRIEVRYKEPLSAVGFYHGNIRVLLLPIRVV